MDIDDAVNEMDEFKRKVNFLDMDKAGEMAVEAIRKNIDDGDFEDRKDDGSWPLLKKTGAMYRGVRANVRGNNVDIDNDEDYAGFVDRGTVNMPARSFGEVSPEDLDRIEQMLVDGLGFDSD